MYDPYPRYCSDLADDLADQVDRLELDVSGLEDDIKALMKEYDKLLDQHKAIIKDIIDGHEFNETDIKCLTADIEDFEAVLDEYCIYID